MACALDISFLGIGELDEINSVMSLINRCAEIGKSNSFPLMFGQENSHKVVVNTVQTIALQKKGG